MGIDINREVLYVDGNWELCRGTVISDTNDRIYIVHTNCNEFGEGRETFRLGIVIDKICPACDEAAPEGLRALYHLMTWK
ncbi:hypothetical protein LCGC14_2804380 [marine sediment metagenome]|uniref:Uncharacterized protein n=1 Tax=marine sediment metagenome TaxID=412755 RepID=A0A0F9AV32_9ZZZZ